MTDPKRDFSFWADKIVEHGFNDHVKRQNEFIDQGYGTNIGVTNEKQYRDSVIQDLDDDSTKGFIAANGREIYYNDEKNTATILNTVTPEKSTHFRPKEGPDWFRQTHKEEFARFRDQGLEIEPVRTGGYEGLHPDQSPNRAGGQEAAQKVSEASRADDGGDLLAPISEALKEGEDLLSHIDLPAYAAAEHDYTLEARGRNRYVLEKNEEEIRAERGDDGKWTYESQTNDDDKGTILDFAARRGGDQLSLRDYLTRNTEEKDKAEESLEAAVKRESSERIAESAITHDPGGRDM